AEGHPRRLADWEVAGVLAGSSRESRESMAAMMERTARVDGRDLRLVRKPDGVVCLHPPRNAAASNSMLGLPALIGGNTLVVKAPRSSPLGVTWAWRELVAPILDEVGAPSGTLNVICSDPGPVLGQWLDSPLVDDVMFFGDSERGIEFGRQCVERGKKPVLELSGNDGVLVWKDAELDLAARALAECFYGSAQICMVPKYAIVHPDVAEELTGHLGKEISRIRPGLPEDPDALLSPVLRTQDFFSVLDEATGLGAELVMGGERIDQEGRPDASGVFLQPTVLRVPGLAAAGRMRAVRDETFYPLLPIVVPEPDTDEAMFDRSLDFLNANPYGLRNSLWTRDEALVEEFCARVSNGGLLKVNDSHLGFAQGLPTHGGTGLTGGPFGEANFPILRTTHLQGISIAGGVVPRESVFDSAACPVRPRGAA
ncbi:MAG TPA: aldehyde dehydrogenase family protein, partial [Actinopolymorphaceae bacterium]